MAAALLFAAVARAVRRGAFRWPAALLLAAGALTAVYLVGLFQVLVHDPVNDFTSQSFETPDSPGLSTSPWLMETVSPGWYFPALSVVLIAAAAAPVAACVLLTRPRATSWIAGPRTVAISERSDLPSALLLAGALLVVHLLTLWFTWYYQPLGSASFADDQSGLLDNRPSWHAPALALFIALAAAWPTTALLLLLRRSRAAGR